MRRSVAFVSVPAGILAFTSFVAAQSITTDPVGFVKTPLLGSSDTYASSPFTRPPEFIGAISSAVGNTITVASAPWTANQFVYVAGTQPKHYYALIGPGGGTDPKAGHTYAITGNGPNTLTVATSASNDLSGITANTQVLVIPYWTPATVFPATDANVSFTPTTSSAAYKTQIRVPDYTAPGINLAYSPVYFFSNNVDGTSNNVGWRLVGDNTTDHGDDSLLPDGYFVVRNSNGAPTLNLTSLGTVLLKKVAAALLSLMGQAQDNPAGLVRPLDVALDATGLNPIDGSFVAGDQLLLFDNTLVGFDKTPSATYHYDTRWRLAGDSTLADRGSDVIPSGNGFIIRKAGTANGQSVFWTNSFPVLAVSAVSRKMHGTLGPFNIPLPLSGASGIECRSGGPTQVMFTFPTAVTINNAIVTSGAGSVGSASGNGTTTVIVNLTGVTNQERITLTLLGVNDGRNTNDVAVRMGVLLGDTNADGVVNTADITQTRRESGNVAHDDPSANFREDVTVDGVINTADITAVRRQSGNALP